jgi:hypothetical protein
MRYNIYLILFSILLLVAQDAFGQVRRYRIELLVLTHLDPPADVVAETAIMDYSAAIDLLNPPPAADAGSEEAAVASPSTTSPNTASGAGSTTAGPENAIAEAEEDPNAVVWLETPSETMDQAWRRLRSSTAFRPEVYFSWEQSNQQPFPLLRIHDATLLFEEDPFAELRATAETSPQAVPATGEGATVALPEPLRFYRIDGTASLRKTRYLHLDLDLQLRVPVRSAEAGLAEAELSRASAYEVFPIRQSRRIQTQNVEYFDGPVIGVLALISRVNAPSGDESGDATGTEDVADEADLPEIMGTISEDAAAEEAPSEELSEKEVEPSD